MEEGNSEMEDEEKEEDPAETYGSDLESEGAWSTNSALQLGRSTLLCSKLSVHDVSSDEGEEVPSPSKTREEGEGSGGGEKEESGGGEEEEEEGINRKGAVKELTAEVRVKECSVSLLWM